MDIDAKKLRLLMQVGFLAGEYGFSGDAETIFEGVRAVRPESESPLIGLAFAKMSSDQMEESIRILEEEALKLNPESDLARGFLGMALKFSGRTEECSRLMKEVVDRNRDEAAVKMARTILDEIGQG